MKSSGRHRRGSVKEVDGDALGLHKIRTDGEPAKGGGNRRNRRLSVPDTMDAAAPPANSRRRASVAPGGAAPQSAVMLPTGGGVVAGLEGLVAGHADLNSVSMGRRRQTGGNRSPGSLGSPSFSRGSPKSGGGRSSPKSSSFRSSNSPTASDGHDSPDANAGPVVKVRKKAVGAYQDQAMFSAMQAALASAHHTLDENKGLLGKIKLLGAAFVGAATLAVAIVVFVSLNTDKDLGQCESATDTQCLVYQVGDGKCDWGCNVAQCKFDKGDCKYYTDACKNAWLQNTMGNRPEFTGEILSMPKGITASCFEYDTAGVPTDFPLKNTQCEKRCDYEECGFDGGDCDRAEMTKSPQCAPGCFSHFLGDGECHSQCDTAGCLFDLRDCDQSSIWQAGVNRTTQVPTEELTNHEHLMCDRTAVNKCGFNFNAAALDSALNLREKFWSTIGSDDTCDDTWALSIVDDTAREKAKRDWAPFCKRLESIDGVKDVQKLHVRSEVNRHVFSITHSHGCREACDTEACGYDSGVCFAKRQSLNSNTSRPHGWCASECSPQMQNDQVCDAECFTAACDYDAPSCNYCNAFIGGEGSLFHFAAKAYENHSTVDNSAGPLVLVAAIVCGLAVILRMWLAVAASLKGFFETCGSAFAKPWSKQTDSLMNQYGVNVVEEKSAPVFFGAPLWPMAEVSPLLQPISDDWTTDENEINEDTGQFTEIYTSKAQQYTSPDGEPLRMELHQAMTGAIATMLTVIALGVCPAIALIGSGNPGLPGATSMSRFSLGNLFNPESACSYAMSPHVMLRNRLSEVSEPECGSVSMPVHAVLLVDMVACVCFSILLCARARDLQKLRKATPRLSDYCVHISGLGHGTHLDSAVQRMVRNISWISRVDKEDMFIYPVWQDDLHWGWAKLQQAALIHAGGNEKADALTDLVRKLDDSRNNIGYPRPFSGHCIVIFNKQHMSRACLHHHLKSYGIKLLELLLPKVYEELTKTSKDESNEKPPKCSLSRSGDHSDFDWLSLRYGGAQGFAERWRGYAVRLGAFLTLIASFVLALALLFYIQLADPKTLTAANGSAEDTASALLLSPIQTSLILIVYTDFTVAAVEFTTGKAAQYTKHTFSSQRSFILTRSAVTQLCILVVLPYVVLGDPFSWNSFGSDTASSVFGKCKYVLESQVGQRLPNSAFIPGGFVDLALWLQIVNALLTPTMRLLSPIINPLQVAMALRDMAQKRSGFRWDYAYSSESSSASVVRMAGLAICYGGVQPLGYAVAGLGLCLTYAVDRYCAKHAKFANQATLRRGAGSGDLNDGQVVCMLLQLAVAVHALLGIAWLEALGMTPNPFLAQSFSLSSLHIYSLVALFVAVATLGSEMEGVIVWLAVGVPALLIGAYRVMPVEGGGEYIEVQAGGPNAAVLVAVIGLGFLGSPWFYPLRPLLGQCNPASLLGTVHAEKIFGTLVKDLSRETDEEAYYTKSTMPFKPKHIIEATIASDVAAIELSA